MGEKSAYVGLVRVPLGCPPLPRAQSMSLMVVSHAGASRQPEGWQGWLVASPRTIYSGRGKMFYKSATPGAIFNYGPIAAGRALRRGSASTDRSQRVNHLDNQILTNSSKTHSRRQSATFGHTRPKSASVGHSWPQLARVGQSRPQTARVSHRHPRSPTIGTCQSLGQSNPHKQ